MNSQLQGAAIIATGNPNSAPLMVKWPIPRTESTSRHQPAIQGTLLRGGR